MNYPYKTIEKLIETRINGNTIDSKSVYANDVKKITKDQIVHHAKYDYDLDVYGSKIEMIEQIKNKIVRGV